MCIKKLNKHNLEDDYNVQILQNLDIDYKKMMHMIVCDTDNMECIVQRCKKCHGFNNLQTYQKGKFSAFEFDNDITDRTKLRNYTSSVEEFIELLVLQVESSTTHSYVAKSKARYLKAHKQILIQQSG